MDSASARPIKTRAGKVLDRLGQYGLPLTLGLFLGYWASDFGVAWLPDMLEALSAVLFVSLLMILVGYLLRGKLARETPEGVTVRRRAVFFLLLVLSVVVGRLVIFWAKQPSPLTLMSREEIERVFELDQRRYLELDEQMEGLLEGLGRAEMWQSPDPSTPLSPADEKLLRETWKAFYDCAFALDQIRIFYEDWYRFDPSRAQRGSLLRSYLLTFAAELALFEKSQRLIERLKDHEGARTFLDAPHPDLGFSAHTFSLFRQEFQGTRDQARVEAGWSYLRWLESTLGERQLPAPSDFGLLARKIDGHIEWIRKATPLRRLESTLRADLQILHRAVRRTWYPTQKNVADWMGDTKVRRPGRYLIKARHLESVAPRLLPGDILLSRKNWYLSNVGLPGFWPHAILHLGTAAELGDYFDTAEVRDHLAREHGAESLAGLLEQRYPAAWQKYLEGLRGEPIVVLEAVGEGVILNSLEGAAGDYLAALRPRLDRVAKAQAILEAFSHLDKPYDFDFDFATDHALVCTEVVWRSYRPAEGKQGLELPLVEVAGRWTLPANEIARIYAEQQGGDRAQLDFVFFLDARERSQQVLESAEHEFRRSHQRFKWDLLLD